MISEQKIREEEWISGRAERLIQDLRSQTNYRMLITEALREAAALPTVSREAIDHILKNGTKEYCSPLYAAEQYAKGNCPLSDVEAAMRYAMQAVSRKGEEKCSTIVVSAFPGTGKTFLKNKYGNLVADSDSSKFPEDAFPENYIQHIKSLIGKVPVILVSSHAEVRKVLVREGIDFWLVYPQRHLKDEYIERYKQRGSSVEFVRLVSNMWYEWLTELYEQESCVHIQLASGQYISNVIPAPLPAPPASQSK